MTLALPSNQTTSSYQPSISRPSAMPKAQTHNQATASSAASTSLSSFPHSDTDSSLSSVPASPHSDTDSSLSSAPSSPLDPGPFPTSLNPPSPSPDSDFDFDSTLSSPPTTPTYPSSPQSQSHPLTPPNCTEQDCPIKKLIRRHYQGPYLHENRPPLTNETLFGVSNPPPEIWKSWIRLLERDPGSTVEDDWNVLGFLRWHVEDAGTEFMGEWVGEGGDERLGSIFLW